MTRKSIKGIRRRERRRGSGGRRKGRDGGRIKTKEIYRAGTRRNVDATSWHYCFQKMSSGSSP